MESRFVGKDGREDLLLKTPWGNIWIVLTLTLFIAVGAALFPHLSLNFALILAVVAFSFIFTVETFLFFVLLMLSLGEYSGGLALVKNSINIYGADFFLVLLIILILKSKKVNFRSDFSIFLFVYVAYGLLSLLYGLFYQEHEIHRAIGEFRRFFFYSLSFFLGYLIIQGKKDREKFEKMLSFVPPVILFFAASRLISKTSWALTIHKEAEDFRAMSYYDGISLIFVFSYLLSVLFIRKKLNLYQLIVILLIPIFLMLSGFRVLWGLLFLSLGILFWIFLRAKKRYLQYTIFSVLVICLALLSLRHFGGGYYDIMKRKLINYDNRTEIWRRDAWGSALKKFGGSPLIGTGLGEEQKFWTKNSAGKWIQTTHPSHNILVDLLLQTGMIGAFLFIIITFKYGLSVYSSLKKMGDGEKPLLTALFVFFVCAFIQALFQPYFNHPGNAISFFLCLGIGARMIAPGKDSGLRLIR